jgi:NAD(P)-dependent dehydrogenase (short-subunit alcohol dehydrogenase family)
MKTAIITGAYGAIGKAIAKGIAREKYQTFIIGRDKNNIEQAALEISQATKNADVYPLCIDLGSKTEIKSLAENWKTPVNLLINNAATSPRNKTETKEGIEIQWAVNVLGYFWMMEFFYPFMTNIENARIVNVASYWAGNLDLNDPEFKVRKYNNDEAYRQSKQADRMITKIYANKLAQYKISVNACHPGDVNSKLSNSFGFSGHESPEEGAETPLWLALSPGLDNVTGKYFEHKKEIEDPFIRNKKDLELLDKICHSY